MTALTPTTSLAARDLATIEQTILLGQLKPEDRARLVDPRAVISLQRGETLFTQGEPAQALYLILEGQMKLTRLNALGDEAVVHVFGQGETFAEPAMFMAGRYPVSAAAISPARVLGIAAGPFRALVTERPEAAFAMMAAMSRHLKALVAQIEAIKLLSGEERLVQFLLGLCPAEGGAAVFELPHDKTLVAQRLGMEPETLSRALARLKAVGVSVAGGRVTIADVARLRERAPWVA